MRKALLFTFLLISALSFSQAPQSLNYQAVARDASGNIITTAIGVRFEILQGSASGTLVYEETNTIIPSSAGVFTTGIGSGTPVSGTFSSINWANSPYFIRVGIDPTGGTSYSTVGTSQLLSVPYALYAETAGNTQTVSISGPGVTGSYPNYTITPPGALTASTGISISGGTITNTAPNQTVNISGPNVIGAYPDYTITPGSALTASTGISIVSGTITNTAPDQIVSISGAVGTYPNFTITPTPATSLTATGASILITGTGPGFTIVPQPSLTLTGNQLSIADGNTVTLPTGTTYTSGLGITLGSGTVITNALPDQTVTISNGANVTVSGTYPNFTVDATPTLSIASGSISISGGNSVALPAATPATTVIAGTNVSVSGTGPTYTVDATPTLSISSGSISISGGNSVALPPSTPATTVIAGTNVSVGGTGPTYTVNSTPTLSIGSGSISISGGNSVALPPATTVIAGTNVSVGGAGPTYTVNATPSLSIGSGSISISGGNSVALPVVAPPTTVIAGNNITVGGTGPTYTVNAPTYSLNFSNSSTGNLTNGISSSPVSLPQPTITLGGASNNVLSVGSNSVTIATYSAGSGLLLGGTFPNFSLSTTSTGTNAGWSTNGNTGTNPGVNFLGTTDAADLVFRTGNTQRMRVYNSTGNVGIGNITTSSELLQVETGSNTAMSILSGTNSTLFFGNAGNHQRGSITYDNTTDLMSFGTNLTSGFMGITSTGKVGIGTTGPAELLQLQSSSNTDLSLISPGGSLASLAFGFTGNHFIGRIQYNITNNSMNFWTNNTPNRLFIDASGNVGINTNSPSQMLHVSNGSALVETNPGQNSVLLQQGSVITNNVTSTTSRFVNSLNNVAQWGAGITHTGNTDYHIVNYPASRWDLTILNSNGNVGMGTLSPANQLHVQALSGPAYIRVETPTSATPHGIIMKNPNREWDIINFAGGSDRISFYDATASQERLVIAGPSGNVGIGNNNPSARLDIGGMTYFRANATDQTKLLVQDQFSGSAMRLYTDASAGTPYDLILGTYPNGHIDQIFLKQSNGFVGMGTSTPSSKLHVNGQITMTDGSQGAGKVMVSNTAGTATWKARQIAFFAGNHATGGQVIPASTSQIVVLTNGGPKFFDDGAGYNAGNGKYAAPVTGVYQFNAEIQYTSTAGATIQFIFESVSNTYGQWIQYAGTNGQGHISLNYTIRLNAGETVDIVGFSSASMTIDRWQSSFSGHLVYEY